MLGTTARYHSFCNRRGVVIDNICAERESFDRAVVALARKIVIRPEPRVTECGNLLSSGA